MWIVAPLPLRDLTLLGSPLRMRRIHARRPECYLALSLSMLPAVLLEPLPPRGSPPHAGTTDCRRHASIR